LFDYKNEIKTTFANLNEWFKNNFTFFKPFQIVNFTTKNTNQMELIRDHNNKTIPIYSSTKFLGLMVDSTL
jgi:5'(3')-deoxyribonucleotidase